MDLSIPEAKLNFVNSESENARTMVVHLQDACIALPAMVGSGRFVRYRRETRHQPFQVATANVRKSPLQVLQYLGVPVSFLTSTPRAFSSCTLGV